MRGEIDVRVNILALFVTLFKSITMFYGTYNIMHDFPHAQTSC
jgi:hypothetical protein